MIITRNSAFNANQSSLIISIARSRKLAKSNSFLKYYVFIVKIPPALTPLSGTTNKESLISMWLSACKGNDWEIWNIANHIIQNGSSYYDEGVVKWEEGG